jgi:hypothetical protein
VLGAAGGAARPVVVGGGALLLAVRVVLALPRLRRGPLLTATLAVLSLAIGLAALVWSRSGLHPNFVERLGQGYCHPDTLYHAAICNMIRTHGLPSPGIDGLVYLPYHHGSHFLFAHLCDLLDVPAILFYQLGYPIIFLPLLLQSLLAAGAALAVPLPTPSRPTNTALICWLVVLAATLGALPDSVLNALPWWNLPQGSESATVALTVFLFAISAAWPPLSAWWTGSRRLALGDKLVATACFPLLVVVLLFLKISVGALALALGGYVYLRTAAMRRSSLATISVCLAVFGFFRVVPLVRSLNVESRGLSAYFFFSGYATLPGIGLFFVANTAWLLLAVVLRLSNLGARTVGDVVVLLRSGQILGLELLAVLAFVGFVPTLVLPIGSNAEYFYYVQQWVAVAVVLGALRSLPAPSRPPGLTWRERTRDLSLVTCLVCVLTLSVLWVLPLSAAERWYSVFDRALIGHGFPPSAGDKQTPDRAELKQALLSGRFEQARAVVRRRVTASSQDPGAEVVRVLCSLDRWPVARKRETVVHVPRSTRAYWEMLAPLAESNPLHAHSCPPLIAPALSGLAALEGLPDQWHPEYDYGFSLYPNAGTPPAHRNEPLLTRKPELCARAAALGFSRVVVLDAGPDGHVRLLEWCLGDTQPVLEAPTAPDGQ